MFVRGWILQVEKLKKEYRRGSRRFDTGRGAYNSSAFPNVAVTLDTTFDTPADPNVPIGFDTSGNRALLADPSAALNLSYHGPFDPDIAIRLEFSDNRSPNPNRTVAFDASYRRSSNSDVSTGVSRGVKKCQKSDQAKEKGLKVLGR